MSSSWLTSGFDAAHHVVMRRLWPSDRPGALDHRIDVTITADGATTTATAYATDEDGARPRRVHELAVSVDTSDLAAAHDVARSPGMVTATTEPFYATCRIRAMQALLVALEQAAP